MDKYLGQDKIKDSAYKILAKNAQIKLNKLEDLRHSLNVVPAWFHEAVNKLNSDETTIINAKYGQNLDVSVSMPHGGTFTATYCWKINAEDHFRMLLFKHYFHETYHEFKYQFAWATSGKYTKFTREWEIQSSELCDIIKEFLSPNLKDKGLFLKKKKWKNEANRIIGL